MELMSGCSTSPPTPDCVGQRVRFGFRFSPVCVATIPDVECVSASAFLRMKICKRTRYRALGTLFRSAIGSLNSPIPVKPVKSSARAGDLTILPPTIGGRPPNGRV